jgi:hypothetical protein
MTPAEILLHLKAVDPVEIDADKVAEIYAHLLATVESYIPSTYMQKLILLAGTMYGNCARQKGSELQLPGMSTECEQASDNFPPRARFQ